VHEVRIERSATKELEALPDTIVQRIVSKIDALAEQPRLSGCKKLKGADDLW
jgi:mRNA interferase RelE/StbE